MTREMTFEHHYPVDPDRLFDLVIDLDTLEAVARPWIEFHHLPSGPVHSGQVIDVAISVLGVFPAGPYTMRIEACDTASRRLRSVETGMGVGRLVHDLEVVPDGTGSKLVDRVEIAAGWGQPFAAVMTWLSHLWRHRIRLRMLGGA